MGYGSWQGIGAARLVETKTTPLALVREVDKRKPAFGYGLTQKGLVGEYIQRFKSSPPTLHVVVQEGWALAYRKYSSAYFHIEEDARTDKRGLWRGAFIAPWDWRHRNTITAILGAFTVPINAQSMLLSRSGAEDPASPNCIIKGNINQPRPLSLISRHRRRLGKCRSGFR